MQLTHTFGVPVPLDAAWQVLNDLQVSGRLGQLGHGASAGDGAPADEMVISGDTAAVPAAMADAASGSASRNDVVDLGALVGIDTRMLIVASGALLPGWMLGSRRRTSRSA